MRIIEKTRAQAAWQRERILRDGAYESIEEWEEEEPTAVIEPTTMEAEIQEARTVSEEHPVIQLAKKVEDCVDEKLERGETISSTDAALIDYLLDGIV